MTSVEHREPIVEYSESHDIDHDEFSSIKMPENPNLPNLHNKDDYSDIYYDRNYIHDDDYSHYAISTLNREINLDNDQLSEAQLFLQPSLQRYRSNSFMRKRTQQVSRSRSNLGEADDQESNNVDSVDLHRNISRDASISRHNLESNIEDYKNDIPSYEEYMNEKPGEMVKNLDSYCHSTNPTYVKENGKQVFKITRYNKSTQKEKIISKNRRIISK